MKNKEREEVISKFSDDPEDFYQQLLEILTDSSDVDSSDKTTRVEPSEIAGPSAPKPPTPSKGK